MPPFPKDATGSAVDDRQTPRRALGGHRGAGRIAMVDRPVPRILVVAPQPFYQDRGTPIALRQVLQALGELGRPVDLVTYPVGTDVTIPSLRVYRSANPFGYE